MNSERYNLINCILVQQDEEIMDGTFLFSSIGRLCNNCKIESQYQNLVNNANELMKQFETSFPQYKIDIETDNASAKDNGNYINMDEDEVEDDEDSPIVVPFDEVEASMVRCSHIPKTQSITHDDTAYASKYPFLFASMIDDEDILMACARILDEQTDVTAVREAAAYLEEVEALSYEYDEKMI